MRRIGTRNLSSHLQWFTPTRKKNFFFVAHAFRIASVQTNEQVLCSQLIKCNMYTFSILIACTLVYLIYKFSVLLQEIFSLRLRKKAAVRKNCEK